MRLRKLLWVVLVAVAVPVSRAQEQPRSDSAARLANAVLDSLRDGDLAREILQAEPTGTSALNQSVSLMTNLRIAQRRFEDARAGLLPHRRSNREKERITAEYYALGFEALADVCVRSVALQEKALLIQSKEEAARMVSERSALGAELHEAWRVLFKGVVLLTHALVDDERVTHGKLQHLRITSAERAALITRILREYPRAEQQKGGETAEVSASVLLGFLRGEHKSADDRLSPAASLVTER